MQNGPTRCWLMKAEPDSRVVKGKDVKVYAHFVTRRVLVATHVQFSVDDFEAVGTTAWEGVRNFEARNLMKEMAVGDKILFYHSNCKNPGIAGFAEVSKKAYPDYTAWDSSHPYFDPKTNRDNPKWFMVDATFVSRARHFVPLSLLRFIAGLPSSEPPTEIKYLDEDGVKAIKGITICYASFQGSSERAVLAMQLVTRGRLSVQRVTEQCWGVIEKLAEEGGWKDMSFAKTNTAGTRQASDNTKRKAGRKILKKDAGEGETDNDQTTGTQDEDDAEAEKEDSNGRGRKRKASDVHKDQPNRADQMPRRKSARTKK